MKIKDSKIVQIIKEDIKRFPVTMYIIFAITILWPLLISITGDTNLIIIGIGLIIAFATYIVETIPKKKKLIYYILSIALAIVGRIIYLIVGLIFLLIFKYKKSGKSLWNYTKSVLNVFLYIFMAFYVETFIVMFVVFGSLGVSGSPVKSIVLFVVLELGVLLFGLVLLPNILYRISEL